MYEVACPSCHAVVATPFVRIGAVANCAACKHRYLIDKTHVKRVQTARAQAGKPEPDTPAEPGQDARQAAPQPGAEPAPAIGDMHGLSEIMRREAERERDSQFNDYDTLAPGPDAPRAPIIPDQPASPTPKPKPEPQPAKPGGRRIKALRGGYMLAATVALALGILGIGLWRFDAFNSDTQAIPDPQELPEEPPEPVYEGPVFQGLPLVMSSLLAHEPWEQPNRPFVSSPPQDEAIYITDARLEPAGAGVIEYTGRIVSERPGVMITGTLTLSLVNPQGTEVARTVTPVALISPEQSMLVQVPIPANLDPTALHPAWSVAADVFNDNAVFVSEADVTTQSGGADTMARVTLTNDTDKTLEATTFVVTAWDENAKPLRRWRVHWPLPIRPGGQVEFFARTGVNPSWDIREWTVAAAG